MRLVILAPLRLALAIAAAHPALAVPGTHEGFVSLADVDPSIVQEIRYAGSHNFLGRPVKGYRAPRCYLTRQAGEALAAVQRELRPFSLGLKVYDCYRPQRAVNDFVAWAEDLSDTKMKAEFYPNVDKSRLFEEGYIADKSGHSRGSTMDLTLVPLPVPPEEGFRNGQELKACFLPVGKRFGDNSLDMGTGYDCFDPLAHTVNPGAGRTQGWNRLILRSVMEKHGFQNYDKEWWHFTLKDEPFPDTYFDFEIE